MIAVPETPVIKKLAAEKQITFTSDSDLFNNKDIKKIVLDNLADLAKTNKLSGLEKIKAIYLTSDPFSIENDILTPTMKIKRNIAAKVYAEQIDAMYKSLTETAA
jgi:long-chain acyl-CoA synthetase